VNRRSFFRGLLAGALTAVAQAYTPSIALPKPSPERTRTLIEQMIAAMERIPLGHEGRCVYYLHPKLVAEWQRLNTELMLYGTANGKPMWPQRDEGVVYGVGPAAYFLGRPAC
jgi:hypothetical protein